jgi:hypothetical protein
MTRRTLRTRPIRPISIETLLILIASTVIFASAAHAQMAVDEITITSGPAYLAGSFTDYFIDPIVMGSGISSVTLSSQFGGVDEELFEVTPGEFSCYATLPSPCEDIASLADITALGDLTFTFVGSQGENDSVTIPLADYDPGSGQSGFPDVVYPTSGATDVPADATLEWTSPPSWVDAIAVSIEDLVSGDTADEATFFGDPIGVPVTETTWAPAGMVGGASYLFELSYFEAIQFEDPRTTNGARDFLYTSAFESYNANVFMVPEPGMLALNGAALLTVFGIVRRRLRGDCGRV